MAHIKTYIPNFITSLNLFFGCLACVAAFNHQFDMAAIYIGIAAVCDFLEGFCARLLHAYSPLGKELDSLADVISFGLAPACILFVYLQEEIMVCGSTCPIGGYFPYAAFLLPVFSALRLAKFNIDERQATSFIGLPTPADAIFWIGYPALVEEFFPFANPMFPSLILILLFSYLMVAEIPMFSLKIKGLGWKSNYYRYLLLAATVVLVATLGLAGLSLSILLYILLALLVRGK